MNQGQEQFLNFILDRVREEKAEEAKSLLFSHFKKQEEGTFTRKDAEQFLPKMTALLKPEKVEEVQVVMKQFANNLDR